MQEKFKKRDFQTWLFFICKIIIANSKRLLAHCVNLFVNRVYDAKSGSMLFCCNEAVAFTLG